jgi:uncharacterized repeat protein (TIGR02543 family)
MSLICDTLLITNILFIKIKGEHCNMKQRMIAIITTICMVVTMVSGMQTTVMAATISVSDDATLRAAISSAAEGDTISVANDITITSELGITKTLIIQGNNHIITVPVPGLDDSGIYNTNPSPFRVFNINASGKTVEIKDLTVKGGQTSSSGAGIVNASNTILKLTNVDISNSISQYSGGGIVNSGTVYLKDSNISRNAATYGGGLLNNGSSYIFIENCTFSENRSTSSAGGGGAVENNGILYANNSTFSNNKSTELGGAINNYSGTSYFVNSTFTGNVSYGGMNGGGAIRSNGNVKVLNSLFAYNYKSSNGTNYVLDDVYGSINSYYSVFHTAVSKSIDIGNTQYIGLADGSDNSLFTNGVSAKVLDATGTAVGTATIYQPLLAKVGSSNTPTALLKENNVATGKGVKTSFTNGNGVPTIGYYNLGTSTWETLIGSNPENYVVASDQNNVTRSEITPTIGAVENTSSDLYMLKVNATTGGTVNGGTVYGDVYASGSDVTLTAIPSDGYAFVKWIYGDGTDAETVNPYSVTVTGNIILQPVFSVSTNRTITYVGNGSTGGTVPTLGSYISGTSATVSSNIGNLVKEGYTFAGWNTAANGSGTSYAATGAETFNITSNATLYAMWTLTPTSTYTITYDGNGNTSGTVPTDTSNYLSAGTVTVLGNADSLVKDGYTFVGWNTAANGSGTSYAATGAETFNITSNATLYAMWTLTSTLTYTVTYNGNGSEDESIIIDSNNYTSGSTITVAAEWAVVKRGCTFAGWNTKADGSGATYVANTTFTMGTGNIVLYAQWILINRTITYDGNGNTGGNAPADVTHCTVESHIIISANTGNLVKAGYTFDGWYIKVDEDVIDIPTGYEIDGLEWDIKLYAKWVPSYTITYNENGSTTGVVPTTSSYISETQAIVSGNTGSLVKTGYAFAGWNTVADGTGTSYAANATFAMGTANIVLYAQWMVNPSYTITYNENGSTAGVVPTVGSYIAETQATVSGNTGSLVKTGYAFAGWNTVADGTGTSYAANATFAMGTANIVLYAQWTVSPSYTITYNENGSTAGVVPTTSSYIAETQATVAENTGSLVKTGYTFAGWNTVADGSGTDYVAGATFNITSNTTLYAMWEITKTYTITYNGNGSPGGSVPIDNGNYVSGAEIIVAGNTGDLVKTGYTFAAWNIKADGSGTSYIANATFSMGIADVVLYAQWTVNPSYTITYNGNGSAEGNVPATASYISGTQTVASSNTGNLVKTGYTFTGWNTKADGSGTTYLPNAIFDMGIENITLYAKWTISTIYRVTYYDNDSTEGSAPNDRRNYISGESVAILGNTEGLVKTGYNFTGWNTAADGNGTTYDVGSNFTIESNVTLYAKWTNAAPPLDATFTADVTALTNNNVTVTINYPADAVVKKYWLQWWMDESSGSDYSDAVTLYGNGIVYAKSKNAAGVWSNVTQYEVKNIDNTLPILTPGEVKRTSNTDAKVKFTSSEAGQYYYKIVVAGEIVPDINFDEIGTPCGEGEITITNPVGLNEGAKQIYIVVKDKAQNLSEVIKIDILTQLKSTINLGTPTQMGNIFKFEDITITSPSNITKALISFVDNIKSGDTLSLTGNAAGFIVTKGANYMYIEGNKSVSDYQTLLRTLRVNCIDGTKFDRAIRVDITTENDSAAIRNGVLFNKANGHYYEYVTAKDIDWSEAKVAAESKNFAEKSGYLATITSQQENEFIKGLLKGDAWLGASSDKDAINDALNYTIFEEQGIAYNYDFQDMTKAQGKYLWITGPEKGEMLWQQTKPKAPLKNSIIEGMTSNGMYSNFDEMEPNDYYDYGERYIQIYEETGKWNDSKNDEYISGYVIEYSGIYGELIDITRQDSDMASAMITVSPIGTVVDKAYADLPTLPTVVDSGYELQTNTVNDSLLVYTLNAGKVTVLDNQSTLDIKVTVTATVTNNEYTATKNYDITIKAGMLNSPVVKAAAGNEKAIISWEAVPNATSYEIDIYDGDGGIDAAMVTSTEYISTELENGKQYNITVKAYTGNGIFSNIGTTTITPNKPLNQVTDIVIKVNGEKYDLSDIFNENIYKYAVLVPVNTTKVNITATYEGAQSAPTGTGDQALSGNSATYNISYDGKTYSITVGKNYSMPTVNCTIIDKSTIKLTGAEGSGNYEYSIVPVENNDNFNAIKQATSLKNGDYAVRVKDTVSGLVSERKIVTLYVAPASIVGTPVVIKINVTDGNSNTTVSQTDISRTTDTEGIKKDEVNYTEINAQDTVDNKLNGQDIARIVIPDANDEVTESKVNIPTTSLVIIGNGGINLEINTENARISIPNESIQGLDKSSNEDLFFRVVPIKQEDQKKEVLERAKQESVVQQAIDNNTIFVVGRPMTIETNMGETEVDIVLPLNGVNIPTNIAERAKFMKTLAVFIEHHDGEKELITNGELVEYKNGVLGIKFTIRKFSTFTIIKIDENIPEDNTGGTDNIGGNTNTEGNTNNPPETAKIFMQDKEFKITFNTDLNEDSITKDSIYVEDSRGNKVNTTLKYSQLTKSVTVIPVEYYNKGESYYLHITDKLLSTNEKFISNQIKYKFIIGNIGLNKQDKMQGYSDISADKKWTVNLNESLAIDKFNYSNIKVYDENCNSIDVEITVVNSKTITVKPNKSYKNGRTYYLFVDGLISETGEKIEKGRWIKFKVADN